MAENRRLAPGLALLLGLSFTALADDRSAASLHRIDAQSPEGLRKLFQPNPEPLPFVSAHRGGAMAGYPENCVATFEHTLQHTHAILEIDPRYTKDGVIVVHHDATLERTTTGQGRVTDFTLEELRRLRLKDLDGQVTEFPIPTLDEVFAWARGKTVLVLDQKDVPALDRLQQITRHKAESFAMLIVYSFADAKACHALNPDVMMEVMIPSRAKMQEFDRLGVPWQNVVAFVGHQPPEDRNLYAAIHERGASCMVGTSRNFDRRWLSHDVNDIAELEREYREFLERGADLFETDIPVPLGRLLQKSRVVPESKRRFLRSPGQ